MIQRFLWLLGVLAAFLLLVAGWSELTAPPARAAAPPGTDPPAVAAPAGAVTATLTPCPGGTTFLNRSITASDTPLPNRVSQNGVASTCGVNKTFTGSIPTSGRHYDQYVLTNNSVQSQCVTVTLI